jgi:phosphomevalonate kinase
MFFDHLDISDEYWNFAISAIRVFYELLDTRTVEHHPISIRISSDLEHTDGRKLGLGSSGAVTAAIIKGLNAYYHQSLDAISIFKCCVISQLRLNVRGSFGDLAAAVYGGIIRYTRFEDLDVHQSPDQLLKMDWPNLSINYVEIPSDVHWIVGWTQQPASTSAQVEKVSEFISSSEHKQYLDQAKEIVDELTDAKSADQFMEEIVRYRKWLIQLERLTDVQIETQRIKAFINICERHGGVGKSSGAGAGDCALAFFSHPTDIDNELTTEGIIPLTLQAAIREVL